MRHAMYDAEFSCCYSNTCYFFSIYLKMQFVSSFHSLDVCTAQTPYCYDIFVL